MTDCCQPSLRTRVKVVKNFFEFKNIDISIDISILKKRNVFNEERLK